MRLSLLALLGGLVGALATVGFRWSEQTPEVVENRVEIPGELEPLRVRTPMVREECPTGLRGFTEQLRQLEEEMARVKAEMAGLSQRAGFAGEAWPEALNADVLPEHVRAEVLALVPADAEVTWACDAVPCTALIVLSDNDPPRIEALRDALEERLPGATGDPWPIDAEGYRGTVEENSGHAVLVQAMPELSEKAHQTRAYYLARHPRNAVREEMRRRLMAPE